MNISLNIIQLLLVIVFLTGGIFLFSYLRKKFNKIFDIALIDIIAVAFVVSIWLLATGKITSFKLASLEIEAAKENAIEEIRKEVEKQREISGLWTKVQTDEDDESVLTYLAELQAKEPTNWMVYDYRASIYYINALNRSGDEYKKKREEELLMAKADYAKSYELHKGISIVCLANICAELNDENGCRKWLEQGVKDNTLPLYEEATRRSRSIDKYYNKEWFKKIKWKGEEK